MADSEDAFAEALRRMSRSYGPGKPPFREYLLKTLKHHCWEIKRKASGRRQAEQPLPRTHDGALRFPVPLSGLEGLSSLDVLVAEYERERVSHIIMTSISPKSRQVVLLRYVDHLTVETIARRLTISPENVRQRLHRALIEIKAFAEEGPDE